MSDIPYSIKFGGQGMQEMSLLEYTQEVHEHRVVGGLHPWYVFKGNPIPSLSEADDSLVKIRDCPVPATIRDAFTPLNPAAEDKSESEARKILFVNAQWALGGEGTGAPVRV